ncbi:hypothetical protein [Paraburkholderia sp. UCT31]|uniref:hypothetical protein n=1 Tax=Paraburkholderia sp. UCT31 TaxID=2615209 RepID=UPI001CA43300|nr:hypothetical protein [Paraburkholderia sp. UCT31]
MRAWHASNTTIFAIVWGMTNLLLKRLCYGAIRAGDCAAAVSMLLLALAERVHSLPLLIVSVLVARIGYALLFMGGLAFAITASHAGLSDAVTNCASR